MKKAILCALMASIAGALMAGPFGLEMGMTLNEVAESCGGREPVDIGGGRYIVTPQKANPLFSECIAWISENEGLFALRANGEDVLSEPSGEELKKEFSAVQQKLEMVYGSAKLIDESKAKGESWMQELSSGQRVLEADWFPECGDVEWVCLVAEGTGSSAYLFVQYTFINFQSAQQESQQPSEDEDVF